MSRAEKRLFIMKRFAAMLLVVAMAFACLFAFAGCGNNDKGNTTKVPRTAPKQVSHRERSNSAVSVLLRATPRFTALPL